MIAELYTLLNLNPNFDQKDFAQTGKEYYFWSAQKTARELKKLTIESPSSEARDIIMNYEETKLRRGKYEMYILRRIMKTAMASILK